MLIHCRPFTAQPHSRKRYSPVNFVTLRNNAPQSALFFVKFVCKGTCLKEIGEKSETLRGCYSLFNHCGPSLKGRCWHRRGLLDVLYVYAFVTPASPSGTHFDFGKDPMEMDRPGIARGSAKVLTRSMPHYFFTSTQSTQTSTRRFFFLASGVVLYTSRRVSPYPLADSRDLSIPYVAIRCSMTLSARCWESFML